MADIPANGKVVEVGSFLGDSSSRAFCEGIARYKKNSMLYCVDSFEDAFFTEDIQPKGFLIKLRKILRGRKLIDVFRENMRGRIYTEIIKKSEIAAKDFEAESVDFVFIDAEHTYSAVIKDIESWYPKLKIGGVMCGHDYGKDCFGVTAAVHSFFKKVDNPICSIWMVKKG